MEEKFPSLVLLFSKSPGKRERINLDGISLQEARQLAQKIYLRFLLSKFKGNRNFAAQEAKIAAATLSDYITKGDFRQEFPPEWTTRRYKLLPAPPAPDIIFNGTLYDLEDRYVLQVLLEQKGDEHLASKILSDIPRDPYLGRVLARLRRRSDLQSLAGFVRNEPLFFKGTLKYLRECYVRQVFQKHKGDKEMTRSELGIKSLGTLYHILSCLGIGRGFYKRKEKTPLS